jgi:transcriptional regulator with AAA-type ATPase domain/tetratricopeptide (TPR) repeat protein
LSRNTTHTIVGATPAIEALRAQIRHLATFDTPGNPNVPTVLVQGETGTGKGLVARAIHASGGRAAGPFVDVNCAAIPDTMLEAELFGFEAGAFTDAKRAKAGLLESAAGGSLFLDEVDSMPLALQGKLLKAIEEKSVRRLGAVAPRALDVKLIAASQRQLRDLVAAGGFRSDLYHRLAVLVLDVPPLRERREDVVPLAEHFLAQHAAAHGLPPRRLDADASAWLRAQTWPGNVRELAHLMERVTLLSTAETIDRATLERLRVPLAAPPAAAATPDDEPTRIRDALVRSGGNVVRAARLLGLGRNALRNRMRRYGIERPDLDAAPASPASRAAATPAAPPPPAPAAPERPSTWEQKPVAVLAIDLVLPESAIEPWTLARRWQQQIEERVAGFGGVFLARSPSLMNAVFGVPRAVEQLPQRAVQAALAIRRLLDEGDVRPELRMAVHLGALRFDPTSRAGAERHFPLGDTLALPARLLGHAAPGEILASAAVARRIEGTCELRERELHMGEATTGHAHVVVGQRGRAGAAEPLTLSRFVGRERELALLYDSYASAAGGHGLVAFVVGDAGMGKSRLLAELRRRLGSAPHLWVEGRCASYGTTTAFLPIIDGLRRFFGIDDRDDDAGAAAKVARGIAGLGDDLDWTVPFIRQVLGLAAADAGVTLLDSATRRSETFRALKEITRAAAARQPLVVVIEDLHWIDPASEEYVGFIADAIPTMRALLVCSHRPGYRHPFGDHSYHVRVTLRALSADETATLSGSILGTDDVPADVQALVAAKAEGNPFFVEEITRSLLEDGTIRRDHDRIVLARDAAGIVVPDTIQDVLSARLDRLADDARRAIQVASVIGREFALRLLERIAEAGEGVRTQVEELRGLELIYEKTTHPELAYMFKHALTHDVAYASVLRERRQALHRTIGLAIEELYADRLAEFYESLAHHFGHAEEWERALLYHERAAEKAADGFANRSVIAHCEAALAIADRLGQKVLDARRHALEERRGLAHFYVSEFMAAGDAFLRAAERADGPVPRALSLSHASFSHFWGHAYDASARSVDALRELARREGLPLADALAAGTDGFTRGVCHGDMAGEEKLVAGALEIAEAAGNEAVVATLRFYLAQIAEWTGDYRRSMAISEQVIAAGRRLRLAHLVAWTGWFLGKAACCLGDYGRAIAHLTEAADVCDRIGDRAWKSRFLNTLGWCHAEIGSHDRAREFDRRARRRPGGGARAPRADPARPRPARRPVDALAVLAPCLPRARPARAGRARPRAGAGARGSRGGGRPPAPRPEGRGARPRPPRRGARHVGTTRRRVGRPHDRGAHRRRDRVPARRVPRPRVARRGRPARGEGGRGRGARRAAARRRGRRVAVARRRGAAPGAGGQHRRGAVLSDAPPSPARRLTPDSFSCRRASMADAGPVEAVRAAAGAVAAGVR